MTGSSEEGYATPAAASIATAIAVVAIVFVSRSTTELRLARADFQKMQAEYLLAGGHTVALLAIAASSKAPPFRFTTASLGKAFKVTAEPEWPKLSLAAADALDDETMDRLGIGDHQAVRQKLLALPEVEGLRWASDAATSKAWRGCANALISPYGASSIPPVLSYVDPEAGHDSPKWRAGQVWRITVTDEDGWRDERIVRFTGNGSHPAVVIARRLSRGWKEEPECETLLAVG